MISHKLISVLICLFGHLFQEHPNMLLLENMNMKEIMLLNKSMYDSLESMSYGLNSFTFYLLIKRSYQSKLIAIKDYKEYKFFYFIDFIIKIFSKMNLYKYFIS